MSTADGAVSFWRNWGELLWVTLDGAIMADGASAKPEAPAARVEAGEPEAELDDPVEEEELMTKLPATAAALASDSKLPMASYMGLLKSRLPSVVTSWRPNSVGVS